MATDYRNTDRAEGRTAVLDCKMENCNKTLLGPLARRPPGIWAHGLLNDKMIRGGILMKELREKEREEILIS